MDYEKIRDKEINDVMESVFSGIGAVFCKEKTYDLVKEIIRLSVKMGFDRGFDFGFLSGSQSSTTNEDD